MIRVYTNTGAGAIAASCAISDEIRVKQVLINFSAAPTSSENLTITLNANAGAAYDVPLYTVDPSSGSLTEIVWYPNDGTVRGDLVMVIGDSLDIAYANTDTRTIGVQVYYEV